MKCILQDLVTENADLQSRNKEIQSKMQELQSRNQTKDRELAEAHLQLRDKVTVSLSHNNFMLYMLQEDQLARIEAELMKAEETNRREQQDRRQRVSVVCDLLCVYMCVCVCVCVSFIMSGASCCRRLS